MRFIVHAALVLPLSLTGGCFLLHQGDSDEGSRPAERVDMGSAERPDGGPDGADLGSVPPDVDLGPPAPAMPDDDLGEDSRPSDHADDWDESPERPDCCDLDPIIELGMALGGPPAIDHAGDGWGVFIVGYLDAGDEGTYFVRLAPEGTPIMSPHRVGTEPGSLETQWAEGRFITARQEGGALWAGLFDFAGVPDGGWHEVFPSPGPGLGVSGHSFGVGRLTHGDDYLVAYEYQSRLTVAFVGPDGVAAEAETEVAPVEALAIASLRSRYVLVTADRGNAVELRVGGPRTLGAGATRLSAGDESPTWGVDVAALRDTAVVTYRQGDGVYSAVFDPFEEHLVSAPRRIGPNEVLFRAEADLVGDDKRNVLGYCETVDAMGTRGQVQLRVLAADGSAITDPIPISDSPDQGGRGCVVGVDADGFLVAWWGDDLGVRVRRARYR